MAARRNSAGADCIGVVGQRDMVAQISPVAKVAMNVMHRSVAIGFVALAMLFMPSGSIASSNSFGEPVTVTDIPVSVPDTRQAAPADLRSGPLPVPLHLSIPSIGVSASVLSVGLTAKDVMDAPAGPAGSPNWQQAFWYRGSATPGAPSTAVIAAHVTDPLGRAGPFAKLNNIDIGDAIVVRDTDTGHDVAFTVTKTSVYASAEPATPDVLREIYGDGPVAGQAPQPSADGLAHLTLLTCTGKMHNGTHDHRLAVYAERIV